MNGGGSVGGWNFRRARSCHVAKRAEGVRSDSKNDNNKSVREAGNNNRESASGTRPKGKNVRPFASEEIVF